MATLGDKVTDTIVNALGKGVEGFTLAQHSDMKAIIGPRIQTYMDALPEDSPVRAELAHMQTDSTFSDALTTVLGLFIGIATSIFALGEPMTESVRGEVWKNNPTKRMDVVTATKAFWYGSLDLVALQDILERNGYYSLYHQNLMDAQRPQLQEEIIRDNQLRGIITKAEAFGLLRRHGYEPADIERIQNLWDRIPGVQDLIRMAVKEAFTPEIAQKFGQYADFPAAVAEWAAKQGLSAEWAQRYWAAHWDLPSTTQGYEMLHRGVIKEEELDLLLRAQDVMPWWRDKLKAIAFSPLTRVDVRRMYQLGVLDEPGVIKAYKELGYNDENSQRMLEFTKVYYGPEDETGEEADRDWTKAEILDGYRKKIITADQARMALREMSYNEAKIDFFLAREDLKATQTRKEAYIDRWHSLYIEGIATADEVGNSLVDVGVTKAEVDELLPLWYLERIQRVTKPTRAELNRFLKKGIITEARWTQELQLMGYSDEYIGWYLADAQAE
jgi:hypothetical protein